EGDRRDQRPRPRDRRRRKRRACARARIRPPARRRDAAQAPPAGGGDPGGRRVLRTSGPGDPERAPAAERRPALGVRNELPEVRRRARRRGPPIPRARAAHRPADARRRHGRGRARVPERARLPARGRARAGAGRAPGLDADGAGSLRAGHRRVARRAAGEDGVLERLQGPGPMVGRAAALLILAIYLGVYYAVAESLPSIGLWWQVAVISLLVIPAVFALVYLALPLRTWKWLLPAGAGVALLAAVLQIVGLDVLANFAKLGAVTLLAWWFLGFFETAAWVTVVALIVPWVDAASVWRGPTKHIVTQQPQLFTTFSFAFPVPGERDTAQLGLPDLLFFALFLGAADRWGLRVRLTWLAMTLSFGATL